MICLGLGSNIGDREQNIKTAINRLLATGHIALIATSSVYETEPVGFKEQPDFLNAVVNIKSDLTPHALLELCLTIEQDMGRIRSERWGPRIIDIDILSYNDVVIDTAELVLPHPQLPHRKFVLCPLDEIASQVVIYNGMTVRQLLTMTTDTSVVSVYKRMNFQEGGI